MERGRDELQLTLGMRPDGGGGAVNAGTDGTPQDFLMEHASWRAPLRLCSLSAALSAASGPLETEDAMRMLPWNCYRASYRFNDLRWDAKQEGGPGIEAAAALPAAGDLSYQ